MKCALFTAFIVLLFLSPVNALVYYQQDWTNNGNHALFLDSYNAPFDLNCLVALGSPTHGDYRSATIISPNFVLSCKHWAVTRGCRIKKIGNTNLYQGKDANGIAHYSDMYIVADKRDVSGLLSDITIYRIKKAINPADHNIPEPDISDNVSRYDWANDPNGYFEDADFASYVPLYARNDEFGKDVVLAGYGPHRIFGIHNPSAPWPNYEYAVAPGILHWGYNQISYANYGTIRIDYDPYSQSGQIPNEVGLGIMDSGTGWFIHEPFINISN
jgi:hypothetical protein